jgi:hypothetical protein
VTRTKKLLVLTVLVVACLAVFTATAWAASDPDVTLTTGPTAIVNGSCVGANDITVSNGYLAIAVAVDSVPPWGVPTGSILDGTTIKDGVWGSDRLTLVDFLPNAWAAWPNTYQTVTVPTETADEVVVQVDRDYNKLQLVTTFTVDRGSKFVGLKTVATNPADSGETYTDLFSGYTFCTTGGFMFGPYAVGDVPPGDDYRGVSDPYGKYVLGYDTTYAIGMHFPAATNHDGGTGWKDLYEKNTLAPGETRTFEGRPEFENGASISPFVKAVADERADPTGTVSGSVTPSSGSFPDSPIVVVEKNGETFTWVVADGGTYSLDLPEGDYELYAVAKDFSPTAKVPVTVAAASSQTQDFAGLTPMSSVTVKVTKAGTKTPIDARIQVSGGVPPVVGFLGKSVFFTDLTKVGTATFNVAAGDVTLTVTSGDRFVSKAVGVPIKVVEGQDQTVPVKVATVFSPRTYRWFGADLHHHSNILDGVTPPDYVVRSELAARLDFTYLSDHDSFANNKTVYDLSRSRGVPFISGDEISPIWAHFNVYPVSLSKPVTIDPSGTAKQIIDSAHAAGMLIAINHPHIAYGYFTAADDGTIPGGYYPGFDLVELQGTRAGNGTSPDERTLARTYTLWDGALSGENKKYYLTGGDDMHDVWSEDYKSGDVRTFVQIPAGQRVTQKHFLAGLKAGHSYVTMGPLVRPLNGLMFGKTVGVKKSVSRVTFSLSASAVYGLKKVDVVRDGELVRSLMIGDDTTREKVTFSIRNKANAWYSFIVEDTNGDRAITNPIWTKMVK